MADGTAVTANVEESWELGASSEWERNDTSRRWNLPAFSLERYLPQHSIAE